MLSLQGTVVCPSVRSKLAGLHSSPLNGPFATSKLHRNDVWSFKGITTADSGIFTARLNVTMCKPPRCSFSSSSNGGSTAENFDENDEEYVDSTILEAVEVMSGVDGFLIKMRDGRHLRCVHNNAESGKVPDYAPHPAIVLKMKDETGLLLPIIVLEMPSVLLMAAVRNVQIARPTLYQVVKDLVEKMGYVVKLCRVTKRVQEAYFAQLYLTKVDDDLNNHITLDLRPSDAINIAVRCKVPIQVNKYLAYNDGMRVIESGKLSSHSPASDLLAFTEWDSFREIKLRVPFSRPSDKACLDTEEFNLLRNMILAIDQERYADAAEYRDKLVKFRAERKLKKLT